MRCEQVGQRGEKLRSDASKLLPMGERELPEHALAFGGDVDQDLAMIVGMAQPPEHAEGNHPVDQSADRVMLELQLPRQISDRREAVGGQPLDGEQQLMLLRLKPGAAGRLLAEHQESAEKVAEPRERDEVGIGHVGNISHYDINGNGENAAWYAGGVDDASRLSGRDPGAGV